jgi:hypothetical protein
MRASRMPADRIAALLLAAAFAVLCASIADALRLAPLPSEPPATARGGTHTVGPAAGAGAAAGPPMLADADAARRGSAAARAAAGGAAAGRVVAERDAAGKTAAAGPSAPSVRDVERATRAVLAAVARDPFRPDRRRAPDRYRLPGEAPAAAERVARRATLPPLWLVGTASFADGGGFAALAVHGRAPLLVPVGDTLAGLRLVRVDTGSAVLEGADTVLLLEVARRPTRGGRR